jgi:hypothetical protein
MRPDQRVRNQRPSDGNLAWGKLLTFDFQQAAAKVASSG